MFAIGIDLGGTIIKIGLLNGHELIELRRVDAPCDKDVCHAMNVVRDEINSLLSSNGVDSSQLRGVSVAFAGQVDVKNRRVMAVNGKYLGADRFDFIKWAKDNWNTSFFIDNDARMTAIGEWRCGAGRGETDVVVMTLGTGVGSAVIYEGKVMRGKRSQFGSLGGHFTVNHSGRTCTCGNIGCVESEAGSVVLPDIVRGHRDFNDSRLATVPVIDFKSVFTLADAGDRVAVDVRDYCLKVWASAVTTFIHAYDPDAVILCGGIMNSSDVIVPYLRKYIESYAWTPFHKVKIKGSELGDMAGIMGAVCCLSDSELQ